MESQGDSVHPDSPESAYVHMTGLLDAALSDGRSAVLVTMQPTSGDMIDVKLGMMNLDQHVKGLLMLAFAVVQMNQRSGSDVGEDMAIMGKFVRKILK
jgi:hypothetical protein